MDGIFTPALPGGYLWGDILLGEYVHLPPLSAFLPPQVLTALSLLPTLQTPPRRPQLSPPLNVLHSSTLSFDTRALFLFPLDSVSKRFVTL